jgi:hypothetical protein
MNWPNDIISHSRLLQQNRPSLNNARLSDGPGPYLVAEGSLDECIREFMAKPASIRHLYEIQTAPQGTLITGTLSAEHVVELARLREFL